MAIPIPLIGAAIGGLTSIGGQLLANNANQNLAQDQQAWNESMWHQQNQYNQQMWHQQNQYNENRYEQERNDMLQFWNMQNEYNSPQAQMARFKAAGLNPHLIYGKGNPGNASTISNPNAQRGEAPKTSDVKPYNRAQMESVTKGLDVFGDYTRFKNLQAQTDNLEAQNNVINQDALLKAQQTAAEALKVQRGKLDYSVAKELRDTQVESAQINLEQQKQNIQKGQLDIQGKGLSNLGQITANERSELALQVEKDMKNPNLRMAYLRIEKMMKDLEGQALINALNKEKLELRKKGIQDGDSIVWRALIKNWGKMPDMSKAGPAVKPALRSIAPWIDWF